jgi:hypothetical protein
MSPSIGWDQWGGAPGKQDCYTITEKIRKLARAKDPESTLNGESTGNLDLEATYLDYTWSWAGWPWIAGGDCRPTISVYPSPRLNAIIDRSPREVRGAFIDNQYLNVFTSKIGGINGSGMISEYPALGKALKQCAKLRKQFLPYFLDGTLIGDCILVKECPGVRVNGYAAPDRALVFVMNDTGKNNSISLSCDLAPWVKSPSGEYQVKSYDMDGKLLKTEMTKATWTPALENLANSEFAVYEVIAK